MRTLSKFELDLINVSIALTIEEAPTSINEEQAEKLKALKRLQNCFIPEVRNSMDDKEWLERLWRCSNSIHLKTNGLGFIDNLFKEIIKGCYKQLC